MLSEIETTQPQMVRSFLKSDCMIHTNSQQNNHISCNAVLQYFIFARHKFNKHRAIWGYHKGDFRQVAFATL